MNVDRCRRLISHAINTFGLDLSGLVVLTEAATGYYALTPLIAAIAGAKGVRALTRDSRFGRAEDAQDATMSLASEWGIEKSIEVLFSREDERIRQADIVTNLGFVRPLDSAFLHRLKPNVAIPLMWETWEYRKEDLDLAECRRLGIPVLGTNESHPALETFHYLGYLAMKLVFELQVEMFRSRIVVIGSGLFGKHTVNILGKAGARVTQLRVTNGESLQSPAAIKALSNCDVIVVVEHESREQLIGRQGQITAERLGELNPSLSIAHIAGAVDREEVVAAGLLCRPERFAPPGYMSMTTDYVGPKPLIDLHAAGLKVGQHLAMARKRGLVGLDAELAVLQETPLARGFPEYHDGGTN